MGNPTLYRASGKGPDSPDGQVVLKGVGTGSGGPLLDLGDFRELLEGSGDDEMNSEGQGQGLEGHWVAFMNVENAKVKVTSVVFHLDRKIRTTTKKFIKI